LQITSTVIEDEIAKNSRHKLMTKYGWIYDLIYPDFIRRMKSQNELLVHEIKRRSLGNSILELGSGSGRQSWLLRREFGYDVHALEICPEMVTLGKTKLGEHSIQVGDARNFESSEKLDAVLLGPLVTCYFLNNEVLRQTFRCSARSLQKGGLIFADFIHAKIILQDPFYNGFSNQQFRFSAPEKGVTRAFVNRFHECHLELTENPKYSWKSTYIFDYDGKISTDEDTVLLRTFFPSEVESLLRESGFENVRFFGCDGERVFPLDSDQKLVSFIAIAENVEK
jgi:SAM-dependent methyltransferase